MFLSFQLGGSNNIQITQEVSVSFPKLLNEVNNRISARQFASEEVKTHFLSFLGTTITAFSENQAKVLASTKNIKFPFQLLPELETLKNSYFFESLADALAMLAFSGATHEVRDHRLCLKINDKHFVGLYFQDGSYSLKENYVMLLNEMEAKKQELSSDFACIILFSKDTDSHLDDEKMKNIVTNIVGNKSYIKPLSQGKPRCFNLTTYIINEANSVSEAVAKVKEVLNFD